MKAALYLRVGTGQQAEFHSAAKGQEEILTALAKEQGMVVQKVYKDIGFSGVSFDRPALQALLQDAKEEQIDSVLVVNLSRLGRDSCQTTKLVKQLQESGVQVRTPYGAVDAVLFPSGPLQQIMIQHQKQRKEQKRRTGAVPATGKSV